MQSESHSFSSLFSSFAERWWELPDLSRRASVESVVEDGLEAVIPLAGLFDAKKELARLDKQKAKIDKDLQGLNARLSNKAFVDKAPANVLEEARKQQAELQEQMAAVLEKVKQVEAFL